MDLMFCFCLALPAVNKFKPDNLEKWDVLEGGMLLIVYVRLRASTPSRQRANQEYVEFEVV